MWIRHFFHFIFRCRTLHYILLGGCLGVFLDVDHFMAYYVFTGQAYSPELARFLHFPAAIDSLLVLCGVAACILGLYLYWAVVLLLRGKNDRIKKKINQNID